MKEIDLYIEDWSAAAESLSVEPLPAGVNAGSSTVGTVSSVSTLSCPAGCVYSYTTASSAS